jgi:hypothetical protein
MIVSAGGMTMTVGGINVIAEGLTATDGVNTRRGWGLNDAARGADGGGNVAITALITISNTTSNVKCHEIGAIAGSITFTVDTEIYYFYASAPFGVILLATNPVDFIDTILIGPTPGARTMDATITGGLGVGDTMTVFCNGVRCYATIHSIVAAGLA